MCATLKNVPLTWKTCLHLEKLCETEAIYPWKSVCALKNCMWLEKHSCLEKLRVKNFCALKTACDLKNEFAPWKTVCWLEKRVFDLKNCVWLVKRFVPWKTACDLKNKFVPWKTCLHLEKLLRALKNCFVPWKTVWNLKNMFVRTKAPRKTCSCLFHVVNLNKKQKQFSFVYFAYLGVDRSLCSCIWAIKAFILEKTNHTPKTCLHLKKRDYT
jgi:hypothetical protein